MGNLHLPFVLATKLKARLRRNHTGGIGSIREYERKLAMPDERCVTTLLCRAISDGADAISFGFRPEIVNQPDCSDWKEQRDVAQAALAAAGLIDLTSRPLELSRRVDLALDRFACRQQREQQGIPISFRVAGELQFFAFYPFNLYGMLLKAIQFRPVALSASENDPQPLRYIYLPDSSRQNTRRFAEVDFEFQTDNSFWVHIRSVREVDKSVRVSDTIF